jgi:sugar lactone lactonase YvrE
MRLRISSLSSRILVISWDLSNRPANQNCALVTGKESSDGLESDAAGNIYSTAPASGSILKIGPNPHFANGVEVTTFVHDLRLLWPDTMSLSDDGYLYVTANQLFNQPAMHNGKDLRQKPYVLFRIKIGEEPIRLQ